MTPNDHPAAPDHARQPAWQAALDDLERSLRQASQAIGLLRHSLEVERPVSAPAPQPAPPVPAPAAEVAAPEPVSGPAPNENGSSAFERIWERVEHERLEKEPESDAAVAGGIGSLPQQYLVTIDDQGGELALAPLHRAFATVPGIEDASLVSFTNGVPVIALRVEGELDIDGLGRAVGTGLGRPCEAVLQEHGRLRLRLEGPSES